MRVVLRPAPATGGSSTSCHSASGRPSRKVLFGVKRKRSGGGPWPGTGRLQPGASATTGRAAAARSAEHTSELQSLMSSSYAVFCLKKKRENSTASTNSVGYKQ